MKPTKLGRNRYVKITDIAVSNPCRRTNGCILVIEGTINFNV